MEDAPSLLKIPKSECPDFGIRLPRHKWPKSWSSMEDLVVPLERNLYGHLLAGLLWKGQFEKFLMKNGWGKVPNWECLFVNREKELFFSVYVDDIKLAGKKQNIDPMWKILMKDVDLGEPTVIHWPCWFGWHSERMPNKQGYFRHLQKYVRVQNLCWSYRKATKQRETWREHFFLVLWYGRSCEEMRGKVLRACKQIDSTIRQSPQLHVLTTID